jgi:hypothetical protein
MDGGDGLAVIKAGPSWATTGISKEVTDWMHKHL